MDDRFALGLTIIAVAIWIVLLCFWGQFWRSHCRMSQNTTKLDVFPSVCAVIPARNEADLLPQTLRSLLNQDYPGSFSAILVDDRSSDGTASVARKVAENALQPLEIITASELPEGWTGKLWALNEGTRHGQKGTKLPDYFLFTDADIEHHSANVRQLVTKAELENLDLVSLMVLLRCESFWEKLLIPAFVFFFQKLYPFPWVNDPKNSTAAAAGGCILIRTTALNRIGGIAVVRDALIDDCALAQAVKSMPNAPCPTGNNKVITPDRKPVPVVDNSSFIPPPLSRGGALPHTPSIWLGLTDSTRSLRAYTELSTIWDMVARTAYTQLNYSPLLLIGTLVGMSVVYLVSPVGFIFGIFTGNWPIAAGGFAGWLLMAIAYFPTLRLYKCSTLWAFCLPGVAFLYTLMTIDSALRHWQGKGGAWKGRVYRNS